MVAGKPEELVAQWTKHLALADVKDSLFGGVVVWSRFGHNKESGSNVFYFETLDRLSLRPQKTLRWKVPKGYF